MPPYLTFTTGKVKIKLPSYFFLIPMAGYEIMPVNTEQWRAEIGSFNGCSLHLIVNLLNLLFRMFLVSFCIIAKLSVISVNSKYIYIYIYVYLTTLLFLCDFLVFLSPSIPYSNFSNFSKFTFIKRSFTNFLYITSFIDVVYSIYLFLANTFGPTWRYRNQLSL